MAFSTLVQEVFFQCEEKREMRGGREEGGGRREEGEERREKREGRERSSKKKPLVVGNSCLILPYHSEN